MKKTLLFTILCLFAFSFYAQAQDFSITIDAEKDAWYDQLTGPENGLVYMPARCYLRDIGSAAPDDDNDLSAFVWMAHDEDYLYVYLEVTDEFVTAANSAKYLNDCIEMKFDPDPASGEGAGTANMRLTALGEDTAEPGGTIDNINGSGNLVSVSGDKYVVEEGDFARKFLDDGYALEYRVPIEFINVPADNRFLTWEENKVFGLAINIGDNDTGTRDNMLQWSAGHSDGAHSDPALCGKATFLPNHILGLEAVSPRDASVVNDSAAVWYENPNPARVDATPVTAESFQILANYPNPFNPETKIRYQMQHAGVATLAIFNVNGELVRDLVVNEYHSAGGYEVTWEGLNNYGEIVSSGVYFYRLTTPFAVVTNKMMLMK